MEILVTVILTYIFLTYIFPMFDVLLELFNYRMTEIATRVSLRTQEMNQEYKKKYPDIPESNTQAIGFHMDTSTEEYEDEEEEYEEFKNKDIKHTIGFKI